MYAQKTRLSIAFVLSIWIHIFFTLSVYLYQGGFKSSDKSGNQEKSDMLSLEFSPQSDDKQKSSEEHSGNEGGQEKEKIQRKSTEQFEKTFGIKGEWKDLLKNLSRTSNLRQKFPETYDNINIGSGVKESYIFRKRHYEDLIVKEVFPTVNNIEKPFEQILREAPVTLEKYNKRNEIIQKFRKWSEGEIAENRPNVHIFKETSIDSHRPLEFPKSARAKYFDSTLRETKESQLYNFINNYFRFDPNKGDLPVAVRELYYDNLQRLVYPFSGDPTYLYIDYFDENLNKEDFLKNSLSQAARLKGTRTQTELLFAINDIYEIQQRAWQNYFDFENFYNNLPDDKKHNLRYETLHRIQERYKPVLAQKKIHNYQDAVRLYSAKREEITNYILKNTPGEYRKSDAMFEKGRIHWDLGTLLNSDNEKTKAIEIWKTIPVDTTHASDANFLNKESLQKLSPAFRTFDRFQKVGLVEREIQSIIQQRQFKRLRDKMEREEKILWPK